AGLEKRKSVARSLAPDAIIVLSMGRRAPLASTRLPVGLGRAKELSAAPRRSLLPPRVVRAFARGAGVPAPRRPREWPTQPIVATRQDHREDLGTPSRPPCKLDRTRPGLRSIAT